MHFQAFPAIYWHYITVSGFLKQHVHLNGILALTKVQELRCMEQAALTSDEDFKFAKTNLPLVPFFADFSSSLPSDLFAISSRLF